MRFIEETWSSEKLGNLCKITMGQSPSSKNYSKNSNDTILIQGNADLISGKIVPRIYTSEITKLSYPGDIILTVRAPVGDLAINEFDSCIGRGVCSIKGNKFIYYYLESLKDKHVWERLSQGSTFESVNSNDIKNLNLKIPSNSTQNHIINFFTAIDTKIELLQKKHGEYIRFKQYLMQNIFADKSAEKLRFNFTDEWEKYLLGDISLIGKGFTPSTSNPSFWDGDLKWLSIADMNQGKYINQTTKKITSDGSKNKEPVKKGTLLMSFKLSIGKLGILTEDMYTNEAICNFKWKNKDVLTEYMYYYLSSINILKYGSQAAKGITLNNETLSTIPVLLPSLEEQKKIINILSDVDMKINMLENSINDTSKFKKGLLQQMFV